MFLTTGRNRLAQPVFAHPKDGVLIKQGATTPMANAPRDDATIDNSDLKARMTDILPASGLGVLAFIWSLTARIVNAADVVFDRKRFPFAVAAIDVWHSRYRYLNGVSVNRSDAGDCIVVGRTELEDESLFRLADLGYQDIYRAVAVDRFTDLKIEA
jgi:hypothetical protein